MIKIIKESKEEFDNCGNKLSPEQSAFFSNSKIRENGNLIVCCHGTQEKFSQFGKGDIGFHFGTEKASDERMDALKIGADKRIKLMCYLNIKNPLYIEEDVGDWVGYNLAWYILQHQDLISLNEEDLRILNKYAIDQDNTKMSDMKNIDVDAGTHVIKNFFKQKGYDGIIYRNEWEDRGSISYIAFYPEQVKLISNKNPSNSKDMNESKRKRAI